MAFVPFLDTVESFADEITGKIGLRFERWPVFFAGLAMLILAFMLVPGLVAYSLSLALFLAPLWLPLILVSAALGLWYVLKRSEFIAAKKYILLEIKPPRNLVKTPLAMETFLSTIHLTNAEGTWWARLMGGTRPFFSLEIASFEGQVHFFIWGQAAMRRLIESQLYAQYPGIQISEAPDYTRLISATPEEWSIWGCDYVHTADDPLPIKTYVEYGLDQVQKEPEQIDPLANLLEFMSTLGSGEYFWLQYVIRAHKGEKYEKLNAKGKPYTWKDQAEEMVKDIRAATRDEYTDPVTGEKRPGFPNPTKGQIEKIAAIERNIGKLAFDVGGRGIYLAKGEKFHGPAITHIITLFKPFTSEGWNGIRGSGWMMRFDDYPWELGVGRKKDHYRREMVESYRRRQYFYDPFYEGSVGPGKTMVMSAEELATVFHIPSQSSQAPGLIRSHSATREAPVNLPV